MNTEEALSAVRVYINSLESDLADNDQWMREVLTDFRIPFDDHKVGRRTALVQWMSDHRLVTRATSDSRVTENIMLRLTLKELLKRVDEKCGGRAQGTSPLVKACDAARGLVGEGGDNFRMDDEASQDEPMTRLGTIDQPEPKKGNQ